MISNLSCIAKAAKRVAKKAAPKKVVKKAAAYSVITQGSNFKGDSKSLSRFRFAFRTAIMKKIDYMERFLEG